MDFKEIQGGATEVRVDSAGNKWRSPVSHTFCTLLIHFGPPVPAGARGQCPLVPAETTQESILLPNHRRSCHTVRQQIFPDDDDVMMAISMKLMMKLMMLKVMRVHLSVLYKPQPFWFKLDMPSSSVSTVTTYSLMLNAPPCCKSCTLR